MFTGSIIQKRASQGSTTTQVPPVETAVTAARKQAESNIVSLANSNLTSVDAVITKLLSTAKSVAQLTAYVRYKRELPETHPVKLATQAAVLRLQDIATVSKATGLSGADALIEIEGAENEALMLNHPDAGILPIDVQACIVIIIDEIISKHANGWDNAAGDAGILGSFGMTNYQTDTSSTYTGVTLPDNTVNTDNSGDGSSTLDSIFGYLNDAIGVVRNASGAVKTIAGNTTSGLSSVNNALNKVGSTAGASAINSSSLPLIIGAGFVIVIIVIIFLYAANKHK